MAKSSASCLPASKGPSLSRCRVDQPLQIFELALGVVRFCRGVVLCLAIRISRWQQQIGRQVIGQFWAPGCAKFSHPGPSSVEYARRAPYSGLANKPAYRLRKLIWHPSPSQKAGQKSDRPRSRPIHVPIVRSYGSIWRVHQADQEQAQSAEDISRKLAGYPAFELALEHRKAIKGDQRGAKP